MLALRIKQLWSHKRRLLGTGIAVILGVAFLTGTLALDQTFNANFDHLFANATAGTDAAVHSTTKLADNDRATIPAALVSRVRALPGVSDAQPVITGYAQLIGRDGKALGGNAPRDGGNWIPNAALNPYRLVQGRAPVTDDEVVINRGAAKAGHLHVGDTTTVQTPQSVRVTIVGLATFGDVDGFGTTTYTAFTLHGAQMHLLGDAGQINSISIQAAPGVSQAQLTTRLQAVLPRGVEAVTGTESRREVSQVATQFLAFLRVFMIGFAAIALLVASFTIYNTFSILVAQRTRETGLLRALGATRGQNLTGVVFEAGVTGVAASLAGLAAGIGIAGLLKGVFNALGFAIPAGGLVVGASTVIVAFVVGVGLTIVAAIVPALRASRIAPIAALRDAAIEHSVPSKTRAITGFALTTVGAVVAMSAVAGHGNAALGRAAVGAIVTIVGVVVLGPLVSRPASAILGRPAARNMTGKLARQNAMRNPRRTAATAAALMVGVTVATIFTVFAAGLNNQITSDVSSSFRGDLAINAGAAYGGARLSPELVGAVARLPDVRSATGLGSGKAVIAGTSRDVAVIDPAPFSNLVNLHVVDGSISSLTDTQLAVSKNIARDKGWRVGTVVPVAYPDGSTADRTITATYDARSIVGDIVITDADWIRHTSQVVDSAVFVKFNDGVAFKSGAAAVAAVAKPFGDPRVQDRQAYASQVGSMINAFLGLVYAMLALSVVIALFGISNTLSLSTYERTRELGLLRAVGQTRKQLRAMVRDESVIVASIGTVIGLGLGVFLGWALVEAADHAQGIARYTTPIGQLVVVLVVGLVAGVLAAIRPARRAARLNVLAAIATE
jgi:putative ABC transport system permease protein